MSLLNPTIIRIARAIDAFRQPINSDDDARKETVIIDGEEVEVISEKGVF